MNRLVLLLILIALLAAGVAVFEASKSRGVSQTGSGGQGMVGGPHATGSGKANPVPEAYKNFTLGWRKDPAWYDGKAEIALYDATRTIYGHPRNYVAKVMTNKERYNSKTLTKSPDDKGPEVFKHHYREDIPTEKYAYHYSTMAYVGVDDLSSIKLDMGSQEDCGASMKLFIQGEGNVDGWQYSYFPEMGIQDKKYPAPANFTLTNSLSLILRGYPFEKPVEPITIDLVPDQRGTKFTGLTADKATIQFVGKETLDLPIGKTDAYHLKVVRPMADGKEQVMDYWFHADGSAPNMHILVQYSGPDGITYKLKSLVRDAYWVR